MRHRPKHVVEYAALRAVGGIVNVLPYRASLTLGWMLAALGFYVVRFRVAGAKRRIREVFGDRFSGRDVHRIAWISFRNMVFNAVEVMRMPRVTRSWVEHVTDYAQIEKVRAIVAARGAILVVPHTGNWDLAGVAAQMFDVPMFFVVGNSGAFSLMRG